MNGETMTRDAASRPTPDPRIEEIILGFVREKVPEEVVGATDDLFALGCDSIDAAQLMNRIRGHFGVEVSLQSAFEDPTPRGLALLIDKALTDAVEALSPESASQLLQQADAEWRSV
jgi:acyl carrier protein